MSLCLASLRPLPIWKALVCTVATVDAAGVCACCSGEQRARGISLFNQSRRARDACGSGKQRAADWLFADSGSGSGAIEDVAIRALQIVAGCESMGGGVRGATGGVSTTIGGGVCAITEDGVCNNLGDGAMLADEDCECGWARIDEGCGGGACDDDMCGNGAGGDGMGGEAIGGDDTEGDGRGRAGVDGEAERCVIAGAGFASECQPAVTWSAQSARASTASTS